MGAVGMEMEASLSGQLARIVYCRLILSLDNFEAPSSSSL